MTYQSITTAQITSIVSFKCVHVPHHVCWTAWLHVHAHLVSTLHDHAVWAFANHAQVLIFLHCYVSTATSTKQELYYPCHLSWNGRIKSEWSTVDFWNLHILQANIQAWNVSEAKTCCSLPATVICAYVLAKHVVSFLRFVDEPSLHKQIIYLCLISTNSKLVDNQQQGNS